ncbi:MAG: alcohol dehydrogenase catalytic domain-containing protein [Phycisphaerales bacterium]|nr:alcohol dehydrogenase catalytic domain-containing protein [Phycisphaerales bacterium]
MKAIRSDNGSITLEPGAPEPVLRTGEALVAPSRLGIDPADAAIARSGFSGVLGGEFVGRVERLELPASSPLAARLRGRRVVGPSHIPCGRCDRCRGGLSLHCGHGATLGVDRDGCFAGHVVVPASALTAIPDALDDDRAVFAASLGRVLHAAQMLSLEGRTFVSVLGDGPLALLAAQAMARRNASVRLLGLASENLELCTKWGVKHRASSEVGLRQDQDAVFDCEGSGASIGLALGLLRPRGSLVLLRAGETSRLPAAEIIRHEVQVFGSRGTAIAEAVAELASGRVDVLSLIAKRLRFEEGPRAIGEASRPGALKYLLDAA